MKLETLLLHTLFALCVTFCIMALTAMLIARPMTRTHATLQARVSLDGAGLHGRNASLCALPADGVICLRAD